MAKLTRKDFVEIADILKYYVKEENNGIETRIEKVIKDFIPFLKRSNPRFDKDRFLEYLEDNNS